MERFTTAKRAAWTSQLQDKASSGGLARRLALRGAARAVGGWNAADNIAAQSSAKQAAASKEVQDQVSSGDDTEVRALTADLKRGRYYDATANNGAGGYAYKTLAGRTVSEAAVKRAYQRWGHDQYAQQAALSYEMGKASTEEELQSVAKGYGAVSQSWGQNETQAKSTWIGSAFSNQNSHLEFKNMGLNTSGSVRGAMSMDVGGHEKFVNEIYEKRGSYNLAQMGSNTIEELKNAHTQADAVLTAGVGGGYVDASGKGAHYTAADVAKAADRKQKIAGIAETFMSEFGGGGGPIGMTGDAGNQIPVQGQAAAGRRQANTPGAAHVAERVRELAQISGVYPPGAAPTGLYPGGHAPTPNNREQK
jgi:hypothetical protein